MAGDKLRINKESQKIKKPVAVGLVTEVHRKPVITYCYPPKVFHVEKENFKQLVQKLTSQEYQKKKSKKNAVLDQTNNVSEASADLSTVVQHPPTEVYSALPPPMVEDESGPNYAFSWEKVETPGTQLILPLPGPNPTHDLWIFPGTSDEFNLFDDNLNNTHDLCDDILSELLDDQSWF